MAPSEWEVLGPRPLLRHVPAAPASGRSAKGAAAPASGRSANGASGGAASGAEGRIELAQEGLDLLRSAGAPLYVAFAIGGSRCGKSTVGNALLFGDDSPAGGGERSPSRAGGRGAAPSSPADGAAAGFQTGGSFDPVTNGVDVAIRPLPGGGALVVGDCEGAFHACGSAHSARGFGALGLVAYHLSSMLLHVSMGSIDERDIEALGFLAASAGAGTAPSSLAARDDAAAAAANAPAECSTALPALVLLVNGTRFDLGDAVARRLLRPAPAGGDNADDGGRWCSRAAIAQGFAGSPAIEALPACEHAAYWPKVAGLRRRILAAKPATLVNGEQATGDDLADLLVSLVAALNGDEAPSGASASSRLSASLGAAGTEPASATEALYKANHLEPIVEDIARRFAKEGVSASAAAASAANGSSQAGPRSPPRRAIEEALAEFDRRAAWLSGACADASGVSPRGAKAPAGAAVLRPSLISEMRAKLAARLTGITEAMARGRQQGVALRPRSAAALRGRPAALGEGGKDKERLCGETPPVTPSTAAPSAGTSPQTACSSTRSSRAASVAAAGGDRVYSVLESALDEARGRLEAGRRRAAEQAAEAKASISELRDATAALVRERKDADRKVATEIAALQDRFRERLRAEVTQRAQSSNAQANAASEALSALREELHSGEDLRPVLGQCSSQLQELRDGLEAERLARREAAEAATRAVEAKVRAAREEFDGEAAELASLRDAFGERWSSAASELAVLLEDERREREARYRALTEVVCRMRTSLEASVEEVLAPSSPAACGSAGPGRAAAASRAAPSSRRAGPAIPDVDAETPPLARRASQAMGSATAVAAAAADEGRGRRQQQQHQQSQRRRHVPVAAEDEGSDELEAAESAGTRPAPPAPTSLPSGWGGMESLGPPPKKAVARDALRRGATAAAALAQASSCGESDDDVDVRAAGRLPLRRARAAIWGK